MKTMPSSDQNGFAKPLLLTILVVLILAVVLPFVYFLSWRPADNNIQDALSSVSTLQKSVLSTMPSAFAVLSKPGTIGVLTAPEFNHSVGLYTAALASLQNSSAIQRSVSAGSVYSTYESSLAQYGKSLTSLAASITTYGKIQVACDTMVSGLKGAHSKSDFDKLSAGCSSALSNAGASPNKAFNGQFFTNYVEKAKALVAATGQHFAASNSSEVSAAQKALSSANAAMLKATATSITINYGFTAPPAAAFTQLTKALNSEKSAIIR
jgi:hypothetical protein